MSADNEELDEGEYIREALRSQAEPSESQPLLASGHGRDDRPWFKRPSLLLLLPPFFFTSVMTGASITPRLSLISNLLCRSYYASKDLDGIGLMQTGDMVDCNIAVISGQIARLGTFLSTVTGILTAVTAARYGAWSDRNGRRSPLMLTMIGSATNDLVFILVGKYYESLGIYFLVVGAVLDGLCGSYMVMMAATYAYTTDIISPQRRAVAFGNFQCCFYGGIALGPTLGGYLVKKTKNVLIVFYIALGIHITFALYTFFILPESLSESRKEIAKVKFEAARSAEATRATTSATVTRPSKILSGLNIFGALSVFFPKDVHPIVARNMTLLMFIDICLLLNMGAFTVIILYGKFVFHWGDLQQGYLLSIIGGTRVVVLLGVLPIIVRVVRGKVVAQYHDHNSNHPIEGADNLDVWLIRVSMLLEVLGFSLMAMAQSSSGFYTAGGISALAGIGMPTLASVLTKHVDSMRTGQLLGAVALMQSLNRVVAPIFFGFLYSATVATHPATSFVVLMVAMSLGFLLSLGLRNSTAARLQRDDREASTSD